MNLGWKSFLIPQHFASNAFQMVLSRSLTLTFASVEIVRLRALNYLKHGIQLFNGAQSGQ
ncbi:hypothetical protein ACHAW6_003922 [Cyclotella cf. meneghiniana]